MATGKIKDLYDIDPNNLDEEAYEQHKKHRQVSDDLADAKDRLRVAEGRLELELANVRLLVRQNPEKYFPDLDGKSPTVDMVKDAAIASEEVQTAQQRVYKLQHKVDLLTGILEQMRQRKWAIEENIFLLALGYNAKIKIKTESGRKAADEYVKSKTRRGYER